MNWISFIIFFFFHLVGILFPFHLCANKIMKENKIMREEIQSWPWKSFLLLGFNLQHMIVNDWDRDHDYAVGWKPDQEKEDSWRSREGLSFTLSSLPNIPFMSSTSVSFSFNCSLINSWKRSLVSVWTSVKAFDSCRKDFLITTVCPYLSLFLLANSWLIKKKSLFTTGILSRSWLTFSFLKTIFSSLICGLIENCKKKKNVDRERRSA